MAMEYRKLGRTGLEVSAIGLGTEHLEQSRATIEAVLGTAVEAGINYVDAVYGNPEGRDAAFWDQFAPALQPYRDRLVLAAHWGPSDMYTPAECQRCFEGVLARLGNDYAEVAFLTVVDTEQTWNEWARESLEHLQRYQEQGRIGHIGLSGHRAPIALKAVRSGLIDVLMFQINLLGHGDEELRALYQACEERGVGLVAMKPYHGGTLLSAGGKPSGITPAPCLHYVLSQPVSTTVPGVKNVAELRSTLHYLEATDEEKDYLPVIEDLPDYFAGQCVYCHHCLPCPQDISVGWMIFLVDHARDGVSDELKGWYAGFPVQASACTECGDCLERCPFGVDIIAKMRQAVEIYEAADE